MQLFTNYVIIAVVFLLAFLSVVIVRGKVEFNPISLGSNGIQYDSSGQRSSNITIQHHEEALIVCQATTERMQPMTIPEFYKSKRCMHKFSHVTFFHVGKGGGGTVGLDLRDNRISLGRIAHPWYTSLDMEQLHTGSAKTLVINIRDPVDRFVSAFRWRMAVLCHPDDERTPARGSAHLNPYETCDPEYRKEESILRGTYSGDPNNLAEALCFESPTKKNATVDYLKMGHSRMLSHWLDFLINPKGEFRTGSGIQNLIALPMEQRNGTIRFEQHIQQLALHLLQKRYTKAMGSDILNQKPQLVHDMQKKDKVKHSSVRYYNSTGSTSLSPLGECCVTRHLAYDYRLIQTMILDKVGNYMIVAPLLNNSHPVIRKACSWGDKGQQQLCLGDLRSMLWRRARYLDMSLGSCSKVVSDVKI